MPANAHELRRLLRQARLLRASAVETNDNFYVELFLRTAAALEQHASTLALDAPAESSVGQRIDILC